MLLLSLLIALALKQLWKSGNPLHHDNWLIQLDRFFSQMLAKIDIQDSTINFSIVISLIAVGTFAISNVFYQFNPLFYVVFCCAILLYSFGRGELTRYITDFIVAEAKNDWSMACQAANALDIQTYEIPQNNWAQLNKSFLSEANYRGCERFFGVVFWFALLGPVGAICYRLCHLWPQQVLPKSHHKNNKITREFTRLIQIIEWPIVRLLGLSYAVTGNFNGCIMAWKHTALTKKITNKHFLLMCLEGALAMDNGFERTQTITRKELNALQELQTRTLWFWIGSIALLLLF